MRKRIIAAAVIIAAVAAAAYYFYPQAKEYLSESREERQYNELVQSYEDIKPQTDGTQAVSADGKDSDVNYLADSLSVNPETVAWLTIPDACIDSPIVQTTDNDYYLHYSFERKSSIFGCPFLDYRCSADFSDFNSIIYGHNISNKYVFAPLLNFKNQSWFDSHEYAYLTTADKKFRLNFFACMVTESDSFLYSVIFLTDREKEQYLETIEEQAMFCRELPKYTGNLRLVVLSTCSYEFDGARTVLIGSLEEITD